eukprot:3215183-Rhodomonas_salina.2
MACSSSARFSARGRACVRAVSAGGQARGRCPSATAATCGKAKHDSVMCRKELVECHTPDNRCSKRFWSVLALTRTAQSEGGSHAAPQDLTKLLHHRQPGLGVRNHGPDRENEERGVEGDDQVLHEGMLRWSDCRHQPAPPRSDTRQALRHHPEALHLQKTCRFTVGGPASLHLPVRAQA